NLSGTSRKDPGFLEFVHARSGVDFAPDLLLAKPRFIAEFPGRLSATCGRRSSEAAARRRIAAISGSAEIDTAACPLVPRYPIARAN
ncbi:MAG TPA: hypothetical protein VF315_08710, partial [Steroidobacteraceae bacterium]